MLKILAVIAGIVGIILLLLLVLLILLLLTRVWVEVDKAVAGPLRLVLGYGVIRIPVLPRPKKEGKPAKPPPPKKEAVPEGKAKKRKAGFSLKGVDWGDAVCLAIDLLLELRNRLVIRRLRADVIIAVGDAAKTGILLGQAAAICGMILPFLEQNFVISDFRIDIDGDFQAESPATRAAVGVTVSMRPIHLPMILLKYWKPVFALLRSLRAGSKAEEKASENDMKKENAT